MHLYSSSNDIICMCRGKTSVRISVNACTSATVRRKVTIFFDRMPSGTVVYYVRQQQIHWTE